MSRAVFGSRFAAGFGESHDAISPPQEDLEPELRLDQLDLFADARLRGVQRFRRGGDVIALTVHFDDVAQLLEIHGGALYS